LGGGERLCCETVRALKKKGHELVILSAFFQPHVLEGFFGYENLFQDVDVQTYPADQTERFGSYKHLLHHARAIRKFVSRDSNFDLVFSTQDAGYIPDITKMVLQWGYFPNSTPRGLYNWPMRMYYKKKIERINLVLAISEYSRSHFDRVWGIPTKLVYPACNMIRPGGTKDNVVVTVARSVPEKRLEFFWDVARQSPSYEFLLLLTQDPRFVEYSKLLQKSTPMNARVIVNPNKELYQEVLAKSKIYLHLMKGEHFGITVVEAMSAGCVPIVHDSGGPKEIVQDVGFLWYSVGSIFPLLKAAIAEFPARSQRATDRAQVFSRERFDVSLSEALAEIASRVP
ncbi:MAG TPA: glycosyltransferase, partial [Candidatus Bathyarchaeia archaeon]|nr:glycosyltransferase [Candidatus Bathyarchaeia archaeon]